ncbi:MAG: acetone carboxylase subunit gamma [Rhodocyclaceae bacterium]|nr:acetone carboxylase subunit gamma [Rhodocyclaceae bacterium]
MKVFMTEYLAIDLERELWQCRRCDHEIGPARGNYKEGLLVYDRDPREIHRPLLDPAKYQLTFSPHPRWCRILEFYCPGCGTLVETEYTVPGHPPLFDMEFDIDALKAQWAGRAPMHEPAPAPADEAPLKRHCHGHSH